MAERYSIFKCEPCGDIIESLYDGGGTVTCCGKPATLMAAGAVDASREKHVPVISKIPGGYQVKVGSATHPMEEKHYIMWIDLLAGDYCLRKFLKPGEAPEAEFKTEAAEVAARAYCNLHGLWQATA
ncbi:MAG: desulfoferrodoxin [Candidatus Adiutrix sp.]|jgi:superoxide reductase|nr:desulfoferrodoxin [Candidatus Adiutrix sp.]